MQLVNYVFDLLHGSFWQSSPEIKSLDKHIPQSFRWKGLGVFKRRRDVLCTGGQRGHLNAGSLDELLCPSWFSLLMFSVSSISVSSSDD